MKKVKLTMMTLMMCLMTSVVFGQWTYEIDSFYCAPHPFASTEHNNGGWLAMEAGDSTYIGTTKIIRPSLSLWAPKDPSFWGGGYTYIDFVLVVNGVNKKYKLAGISSYGGCCFDESIWTDEFIKDFKSASKCSITVYRVGYTIRHYHFDFSGSAAAYNFITK